MVRLSRSLPRQAPPARANPDRATGPAAAAPVSLVGGEGEKRTLRLVAQYADACNIGGGASAAHKLDVLRAHCDTVGRDYDDIGKTSMFANNPTTTVDDILGQADWLHELGFTVAYLFASRMPKPRRIMDLIAPAIARLR